MCIRDSLGTYNYYVEKKASIDSGKKYLQELSEEPKKENHSQAALSAAEQRALNKQKEAEERRLRRQKEQLEDEINTLENEIAELEAEMCKTENISDHQLLGELDKKAKEKREKLEEAYDKWLLL